MEKRKSMWGEINFIKESVVCFIVASIGEEPVDLSGENITVVAIEHHCGQSMEGPLMEISREGFVMGDGIGQVYWYDMILEDLVRIHDWLVEGHW